MQLLNGKAVFPHFCIRSGVRQGGVLSPSLFSIYIRQLIDSLKKSDFGCHVHGVYVGCIVYADDVILLSASVLHLQKMLDICSDQAADIDIVFNAKKSSLFAVGKLLFIT